MKDETEGDGQFAAPLAELVREYPAPSEMGETDQERSTANFPNIKQLVKRVELRLNEHRSVADRDRFIADSGYGTGTLAHVPYFTVFRSDETDSSLYGLYVVYLIDPVTDTVYLTLNQGASEAGDVASNSGTTLTKKEVLAAHAEYYREQIDIPEGWETASAELSTELGKSAEYNAGTICYTSYGLSDLENTEQVLSDLETACELYDSLLDTLYGWPAKITETRRVWKISPEGGEYWDIWRSEGVASIHWPNTDAPDPASIPDVNDIGHPRSGERQVYTFENEISEGDILIAGSLSKHANKVFGVGVVESDHATTDQENTVPEDELQKKTDVHRRFIGVKWYPVAERYLPITVAKDGEEVFHQQTIEQFSHDEFRRLLGAIARRRAILELEESPTAALQNIEQILYEGNTVKIDDSELESHGHSTSDGLGPYSGITEATEAIREQLVTANPDNWLGSELASGLITEWTAVLRRNSTVENEINPNDVHVYEQLYDLYHNNRGRLQTEANKLNVQQIENSSLTPAQVLFTVLIRDLQLQADLKPNFNHVKMDQLLDERFRQPPLEESMTPPKERETIARQLSRAKQIVFHGPPGTGKTYTAREFARWWIPRHSETPTEAQLETVTFHPSFTYEDFIEGLTARENDGGVEYAVEAGVFKQFCDRARRAYEAHRDGDSSGSSPPYVFIIDEINRGNLAQIFGEIITLLEPDKRQDAASETATILPHSNERFTVPPNLYVIGTMNTADRSIALVDAALRRRFRFIHFPPSMTPLESAYGFDGEIALETLATEGNAADSLLALSILAWKQLNARIRDVAQLGRGKQLGHSYLLGIDQDADPTEQVAQIVDAWQFEILPLLEEYYFGQFIEIERQLFGGNAGELLDTDRQEIRAFTAGELATVLAELTGLDTKWAPPTPSDDSFSNSLAYLADQGVLEVGDELHFDIDGLHEDPEPEFEPDSDYWVCTVADLGAQKSVRWAHDGELHSLSELAERIDHDHRDTTRTNYAGPTYWYIPGHEEYSLLDLARAIQDGEVSPDQLRSVET